MEWKDLHGLRLKRLVVVGHDAGEMNDGGMQRIFARVVGAELMPDGLLDLRRHAPGADRLGPDFSEVAANGSLFDFGQRGAEIAGFDERGLGALRECLIKHEVADVAQQSFDEESFTVFDAAGFRDLSCDERGKHALAPMPWSSILLAARCVCGLAEALGYLYRVLVIFSEAVWGRAVLSGPGWLWREVARAISPATRDRFSLRPVW